MALFGFGGTLALIFILVAVFAIIGYFIYNSIEKCNVAPPTNISGEYSRLDQTAIISWDFNPDVDGYNVYQGNTNDFEASESNIVANNITGSVKVVFKKKITEPGIYFFKVASIKGCVGEAGPNPAIRIIVCERPKPPSNVQARKISEGREVEITWNASTDNTVTGYIIYVGGTTNFNPLSGNFKLGETSQTSFIDRNVSSYSGDVYYKVSSFSTNRDCTSEEVPIEGALVVFDPSICPILSAPQNPRVDTQINPNTFSWDITPDLQEYEIFGYNIYRGTNPDFTPSSLNSFYIGSMIGRTSNSFDLNPVRSLFVDNTQYYLKVATFFRPLNDPRFVGRYCNSVFSVGVPVRFT